MVLTEPHGFPYIGIYISLKAGLKCYTLPDIIYTLFIVAQKSGEVSITITWSLAKVCHSIFSDTHTCFYVT